jgi:hypothetical protein
VICHREEDPHGVGSTELEDPSDLRLFAATALHHGQKLAHSHGLRGRSNRAIYDLAALRLAALLETDNGQLVCRWGLRFAGAKGKKGERKEHGEWPQFTHEDLTSPEFVVHRRLRKLSSKCIKALYAQSK